MQPEIVVTGRRDYYFSQTIDRAGIWIRRQKQQIEGHVGEFLANHPGAALALNIASIGLTIAGGPVRFVGGKLFEAFEGRINGYLTSGFEANGWDVEHAALGGSGTTFVGSLLLSSAALAGIGTAAGLALRRGAVKGIEAGEGGLNLFKWGSDTTAKAGGWRKGDFMLHLPDKGSPQANWAQNAGRLREQMGQGKPIFDSYRDPVTGLQITSKGFLGAERNLFETRGWIYDSATGAYHPPVH